MEGKTNFSRRLKQFDGLTWPRYFTTDLRHCQWRRIFSSVVYGIRSYYIKKMYWTRPHFL